MYRLGGVGHGGTDVIAKSCSQDNAAVEQLVYQRVLPHLPISSLHFYGCVELGQSSWLFIESVGGASYDPLLPEHRVLAGRWLALTHTLDVEHNIAAKLPPRGSAYYRTIVETASATLDASLFNPMLDADETHLLERLRTHCERLLERWCELVEVWEALPEVLVHGDFWPKNLRVQECEGEVVLTPFDWGEAGWGTPAADLAEAELNTYHQMVLPYWPQLELQTLERAVRTGKILRVVAAIPGEAPNLTSFWSKRAISKMRSYTATLAEYG